MYLEKNVKEKIQLFENQLIETNRGFNYYINWDNIKGYEKYSIEIHSLDCLIGQKTNFDFLFTELLKKLPCVVEVFPYLFALSKVERNKVCNQNEFLKIIGTELDSEDVQCFNFNGSKQLNDEQIKMYLLFFEQMGLKNLYQNIIEKSTLDYITGVLVGLDSNGRKNRGGTAFELACEPLVKEVCQKYGVEVITQKQFKILIEKGFKISDDIANRKADFILLKDKKCVNIEVNFFNGGGSKPEEIIDSYINRQSNLKENNIGFVLITDGNCWKGTTNQLTKGFTYIEYLLNYRMTKSGALDEIISKTFGE
ncbi:MAG: type II restriction endonuclease [Clostridia bacterium]|nr:type II restriction endonuclease [Clostridia bacterium]